MAFSEDGTWVPHKNRGGRKGFIDMTGREFDKITVIRRASPDEIRAAKFTNFSSARWICICQCGAEKMVLGSNLRNGKTKSCGAATCCYRPTSFDKIQPKRMKK